MWNIAKLSAVTMATAIALVLARGTVLGDIPLNADEVKCVNALNKRGAGVAKAQNKENRNCIKSKGKGKLVGTVDACLMADSKGKVMKKQAKTDTAFAKKCGDVPDIGPDSNADINPDGVFYPIGVVLGLFGSPADPAILSCSADKPNCKCQDAVIKNAGKVFDAKVRVFLKCKKAKGKDSIDATADLADCVDGTGAPKAGSIALDGKGKISKKVTKLGEAIDKKCAGVPATNAFPGECTGLGGNALRDCVDALVECQVCLMLSDMDNMFVDCDLFDDGLSNGSCFSPD